VPDFCLVFVLLVQSAQNAYINVHHDDGYPERTDDKKHSGPATFGACLNRSLALHNRRIAKKFTGCLVDAAFHFVVNSINFADVEIAENGKTVNF